MRKTLIGALGAGLLATPALMFPVSAIAAPMGIAIIGDRWEFGAPEYQPAFQRCALNAYRPTFKDKGKGKGKHRPINPRWGGPQPDPPGRR
jgi:hypothetical protein